MIIENSLVQMEKNPENRVRLNPKITSELGCNMECFEMNDLTRQWSCIIADNNLLTGNQLSTERYYKKSVYDFSNKLNACGTNFTDWDVIKYGDIVGLNVSENRKVLLYHKTTWNDRMKGFDKANVLDLNKE